MIKKNSLILFLAAFSPPRIPPCSKVIPNAPFNIGYVSPYPGYSKSYTSDVKYGHFLASKSLENDLLLTMLEKDIVPLYYTKPTEWLHVVKQSMSDVVPFFDSNRMAHEYYDKMYSLVGSLPEVNSQSSVEAV